MIYSGNFVVVLFLTHTTVRSCDDLLLVHWTDVTQLEGRPVHLDASKKIKFSVPFLVPKRQFKRTDIVVPDTGQRMQKVTKQWREQLSDKVYRFFQFDEVAALTQVNQSADQCLVCAKDISLDTTPLTLCSLRLCALHERCAPTLHSVSLC